MRHEKTKHQSLRQTQAGSARSQPAGFGIDKELSIVTKRVVGRTGLSFAVLNGRSRFRQWFIDGENHGPSRRRRARIIAHPPSGFSDSIRSPLQHMIPECVFEF
jgi:hypothetical protein